MTCIAPSCTCPNRTRECSQQTVYCCHTVAHTVGTVAPKHALTMWHSPLEHELRFAHGNISQREQCCVRVLIATVRSAGASMGIFMSALALVCVACCMLSSCRYIPEHYEMLASQSAPVHEPTLVKQTARCDSYIPCCMLHAADIGCDIPCCMLHAAGIGCDIPCCMLHAADIGCGIRSTARSAHRRRRCGCNSRTTSSTNPHGACTARTQHTTCRIVTGCRMVRPSLSLELVRSGGRNTKWKSAWT
jgi:hypothetical protein